MNKEQKSALPKGYVSTSDLPQSIAAKLRTGDLSKPLGIWLDWMWQSAQPPTDNMAYEAISIIESRMEGAGSAIEREFIKELIDYQLA